MQLHDKPESAECMIVLGSRDDRVALLATELLTKHTYEHVLITGGVAHTQDMLHAMWGEVAEAEHFASVMRQNGYQGELLLEKEARNTGENAAFSHKLLESKGIRPRSLLLVTKPYMERRAKATFEKQWPDQGVTLHVTSQATSFNDYISHEQPADTVINIMVGDLWRVIEYPRLGHQSYQAVPGDVGTALKILIGAGYDKHLPK